MKIMTWPGTGFLGLTLSSALLLSGCNNNSDSAAPSAAAPPTRTVLVYMVGSDLESKGGAATADLAEMMKVGSAQGFNIVVETGGANKPGWTTVKRQLVGNGSLTSLADLGSKNMGDQATLQDFIAWGMKTYPADKYTLVFWDHGGGAVGSNGPTVGFDEIHGDGLSLPEIDYALKNSAGLNKQRFDLIGFDTCLMATLETARISAGYADYMVGSEETEPGSGWDYTAWLGTLKTQPTMSTLDLGKTIVNSYFKSFPATDPQSQDLTLSAIQLNKVEALTSAVSKLALKIDNRLASAPDATRLEMAVSRSRSESYGKQNGDDAGMIDLNDFVNRLPAAYTTEATAVRTALGDAVAYTRRADQRPGANGVSIYLPSETTIRSGPAAAVTAYKQVQFDSNWVNLVDRYTTLAAADKSAPVISNEQLVGNNLSADVSGTDIRAVNVYLTHLNTDGTLLVLSREESDNFTAGHATYAFDNKILLVNGQYVYTEVLDLDSDNSLATLGARVIINGTRKSTLVIRADFSNPNNILFTVLGEIPETPSGAVSRINPLKQGDSLDPLFLNLDPNTLTTTLVTQAGNAFTVGAGGITPTIGQLPPDTYKAFFAVEDFSGNTQYGNAFDIVVK